MARRTGKTVRQRSSLLAKLLLFLLLTGICWQLLELRDQVAAARDQRDQLAAQVEAQRQENDALSADIAEGATPEKIEEVARNELGLVSPGDYLFPDGGS